MSDHSSPDRAALIAEAERLLCELGSNCNICRVLRALLAVVREGEQEKARYENAQCITCARDLDALASRASAPEGPPRCQACREVGVLHCAHPEECGNLCA